MCRSIQDNKFGVFKMAYQQAHASRPPGLSAESVWDLAVLCGRLTMPERSARPDCLTELRGLLQRVAGEADAMLPLWWGKQVKEEDVIVISE